MVMNSKAGLTLHKHLAVVIHTLVEMPIGIRNDCSGHFVAQVDEILLLIIHISRAV